MLSSYNYFWNRGRIIRNQDFQLGWFTTKIVKQPKVFSLMPLKGRSLQRRWKSLFFFQAINIPAVQYVTIREGFYCHKNHLLSCRHFVCMKGLKVILTFGLCRLGGRYLFKATFPTKIDELIFCGVLKVSLTGTVTFGKSFVSISRN